MDPSKSAIFLFLTGNTFFEVQVKISTYTNSKMQNSMVMFTFSIFDRKGFLGVNLVQIKKIVGLSWNLVPTISFIIF